MCGMLPLPPSQYERRKEIPVKVRKERKPRTSKTPAKKRKLSKTSTPGVKKTRKKRRRYTVRGSDSNSSEEIPEDDSDSDYDGT